MRASPLLTVCLALAALLNLAFWYVTNQPQDAGPGLVGPIRSVSFAPFREGQSPLTKTYPSRAEIEQDLALLQGKVRGVRTYTSREGMEAVPELAGKYGIKVTHSAWLGNEEPVNRAEVKALIKAANEHPDSIERVIVGNEVLLRRDLKPQELIESIREVKRAVKQPVSYADVWAFYLKYPEVAKEVDFLTIHILPYWEDEPVGIDEVGAHIERIYRKMQAAFPGKPILIGEAGWPTAGRSRGPAAPGVVNSARFLRNLVAVAEKNGFDYNVVEAFDQPWKSKLEGTVGANWGYISVDRQPRFPLDGPVVEHSDWTRRFARSMAL
ncbi:MAG: exo-beta-1,3-glucanase, partial [Rhodospirillales bacterium]|nr:exo-beta-1,3-glucanase [Rhodospirillales bacterium]